MSIVKFGQLASAGRSRYSMVLCMFRAVSVLPLDLEIIHHRLPSPAQPRCSNHHLDRAANPQCGRHTSLRLLQPSANDSTYDHQEYRHNPPVALHVLADGRYDQRVGEQVAIQRSQHICWHFVEPQDSARHDLSSKLEGQQRHREQGDALSLVARKPLVRCCGAEGLHTKRRDRASLGDRRGDKNEGGLDEERSCQSRFGLGTDTA